MNKLYITIILLFGAINSNAQFKISGVVLDSILKEPLPNASIFIEDIKKGSTADINGHFDINNLPKGKYKLKISYISYSDKYLTININNNIQLPEILLSPKTELCLHQVVITAGTYSTQDETAIKIETINKKDIEGFGGVSLIKDLSRIPGIDAVSKGNGIATPIIRGMSTNNILVLNNGVKMQNFQFSTNHPYMIDEFGVERIEVVKGPASLLFGSNAVGGALNLIKESPATKGRIKSDINISYNSNTKGIVTNVGIRSTPNDIFFGLRAGIKTHKDYKDGNDKFVPNSRFNEKSFKFFTGISKKNFTTKIFLDYNLMKLGLTVPPAIKIFTSNQRKNTNWYQDLSNVLIYSKSVIYSGKFRNEINVNYQTNNRKLFENPNNPDEFKTVNMNLNTLTYEMKTTKDFNNHHLIFAFQGLSQINKNNNAPEHVLPNFNLNDLSGMGLIQLNFIKKIHAQLGLRYDFRSIDIPKQETIPSPIYNRYHNISYSLGSTFNLSQHILLRANFASGYRTPSIAELSQDGGHGARFEKGNPNLKTQQNTEGDMSLHYHNNKLIFEISGFYNKIKNYIFLSPTKDTTIQGFPVFLYSQTNATLYGIESNIGYFPTKWMNLNLAYNNLVAKKGNGDFLPLLPQNKLRGNISFSKILDKKLFKKIAFSIESIYAFEQNKHHVAETNTEAFNIYNLSLVQSFLLDKHTFKISIKVNNILNSKYIDHVSTLKGLGYYNIGRNINIGLKLIFDKNHYKTNI